MCVILNESLWKVTVKSVHWEQFVDLTLFSCLDDEFGVMHVKVQLLKYSLATQAALSSHNPVHKKKGEKEKGKNNVHLMVKQLSLSLENHFTHSWWDNIENFLPHTSID